MARRDSIPLYKIIVLGDGGVGKTALTIQLCMNHFVETYDPTIEDSYRKQVVIDDDPATLEVLDTAGQEEYTALRDQWIREGEGFILVYSITSRSSFTRIKTFFNQIQRVKEDAEPYSVVIVGNKSDRNDEREVSTQEGEVLAKELGDIPFFESSAKYNINTETAFLTCAKLCKQLRGGPSIAPPPASTPGSGSGSISASAQAQQQAQVTIQSSSGHHNHGPPLSPATDHQSSIQQQQQQQHIPSTRRSSRNYIPPSSNINNNTATSSSSGAVGGGTTSSSHHGGTSSSSGGGKHKKDKKCVIM
ncbi:uncharacterized protein SAPINGB_P002510 [Magnusiomyces paraingens]|uniref:Protein ras-2 n=1 Tax=Magnusiomyces paraingens TaxID=2606893 RepID=A0A5E8BGD8_9ASCO|nr:uncharacterized protein SAPINGB_P002510 [Saprochaete ingens]VVT49921.1 unnamed protein product [Saprochaete ingens]